MADDPNDLIAGYTSIRDKASAGYAGALRHNPRSAPVWTCRHTHAVAVTARRCAEEELERRRQGQGEVFSLLHCERCTEGSGTSWWADQPGEAKLACPRCGVPLTRLKLVVTGRETLR